jgi:hypothetical protein
MGNPHQWRSEWANPLLKMELDFFAGKIIELNWRVEK